MVIANIITIVPCFSSKKVDTHIDCGWKAILLYNNVSICNLKSKLTFSL